MKTYINFICWILVCQAFLLPCASKHRSGRSRRHLVKNLRSFTPKTRRCGWKHNHHKHRPNNFETYEWFDVRTEKNIHSKWNKPWSMSLYWKDVPANWNIQQSAPSYWQLTPRPIANVMPVNNYNYFEPTEPSYVQITPRVTKSVFANRWNRPNSTPLYWYYTTSRTKETVPPINNWHRPQPEPSYWQLTTQRPVGTLAKCNKPQSAQLYWQNTTPKVIQPVPPRPRWPLEAFDKPDCNLGPLITTPMNCWPNRTTKNIQWFTNKPKYPPTKRPVPTWAPKHPLWSHQKLTKKIKTSCKNCPIQNTEDSTKQYTSNNFENENNDINDSKSNSKDNFLNDTNNDISDKTKDDTKDNNYDNDEEGIKNNEDDNGSSKDVVEDITKNDSKYDTKNNTEKSMAVSTQNETNIVTNNDAMNDTSTDINNDTVNDTTNTTKYETEYTNNNINNDVKDTNINTNDTLSNVKDDTNSDADNKDTKDNIEVKDINYDNIKENGVSGIDEGPIETRRSRKSRSNRDIEFNSRRGRKRNYRS